VILTVGPNGTQFPFFNEVNITLTYNSIADTFSYKVYFDPNNKDHKEAFRPLSYHNCTITNGGVLVLTGTILNYDFEDAGDPPKSLVQVEGYSQTGILQDCNLTYLQQAFQANGSDQGIPSQFNGLNLMQIAAAVCSPFNLSVKISQELLNDITFMKPYPTCINDSETNSIADFLDKLCTAKNVVLSHTEDGRLHITRANANKIQTTTKTYVREDVLSTATLDVYNDPGNVYQSQTVDFTARRTLYDFNETGQTTWTNVEFNINGQSIHTYISVIGQAQDPSVSSANALAFGINILGTFVNTTTDLGNKKLFHSHLRFRMEQQRSGDDNDTPLTARAILGDELKNITLTFTIKGWTLNGNLIKPNQLITVINPNIYLYNKTTFFITQVVLFGNEKTETATITCVLVECFNNDDLNQANLSNKYPIF
jgi:prophage tail gpP-like protein